MTPATPDWLTVLGPLPPDQGKCTWDVLDGNFEGWEQVRFAIGDRRSALRVVTASFGPGGQLVSFSDFITTEGGYRQEHLRVEIGPHGRVNGTHWRSEGEVHVPQRLTEDEWRLLCDLAEALRSRSGEARP